MTSAIPQYGPPSAGGPPPGAAPPPPPPAYAAAPGGPAGGAPPPPAYAAAPGGPAGGAPPPPPPFGSAPGGAAGGSSGGQLSVQCKAAPDGSGKIKYDCSGVNKDAITLKTEHFLWLESPSSSSQNLDIEIPNYNIDEFIKAAYKALGPQEGAKINILLKKPDVTYNAEKGDAPKADQSQPAVNVNYQPVDKISVHYPSQKAYGHGGPAAVDPLAGGAPPAGPPPAGPPAPGLAPGPAPAGGGAYSRPQRESGYRYYFIRQ